MGRVNGYLLDTNIITYLARPDSPKHNNVKTHLLKLGSDEPVMLSVVTIAEIEFGIAKAGPRLSDQLKGVLRRFFESYPLHLGIDDNTVEPYSLVRAELWRKSGGGKVPEDRFERITGKQLGIDERDLLIASVAIQYGLVLVTADKKMKPIIDAARELEMQGEDVYLRWADWTLPI